MELFHKAKAWYEEYEDRISIGSLLLGFIVDSFTLQSIDALREDLWIAGNLFLAGLCIILLNRKPSEGKRFWFGNILQFSFGALFGSLFIFYFRSATLSVAWPFLLMLIGAMLANEFFQKRYEKLAFQLSFFYFSLFSFMIFLVPLVVKEIGPEIFVLSGGVSLLFLWIYIFVLGKFATQKFLENRTHIWTFVTVIFVGVNILYFTNLIPPIPLSLKDAGLYHAITKNSAGEYLAADEKKGLTDHLSFRKKVHWQEGEWLYAYSAIFSPGSINTDIVHHWQYKNEAGEWVTATRIPLYLSGGRSGGFRTFSKKETFTAGDWRVDVETPRGQLIGRLNFKIIPTTGDVKLVTEVKE